MSNAVEFVTFKLKNGSSVPEFLLASEKMNKEFLSAQKGYISRKLIVSGELWADFVLWETMEDALNAAKSTEENTAPSAAAAAYEYFAFLDEKSCDMKHFTVEKSY